MEPPGTVRKEYHKPTKPLVKVNQVPTRNQNRALKPGYVDGNQTSRKPQGPDNNVLQQVLEFYYSDIY